MKCKLQCRKVVLEWREGCCVSRSQGSTYTDCTEEYGQVSCALVVGHIYHHQDYVSDQSDHHGRRHVETSLAKVIGRVSKSNDKNRSSQGRCDSILLEPLGM